MANDFYTHSSYPATGSQGSSALARAEFDAVMAGFDKMPALTGNAGKFVVVNSGASALSVASSISESAGNLSIAGSQLTIVPAVITWSGNPAHSGNHTFSGNVTVNGTSSLSNTNVRGTAGAHSFRITDAAGVGDRLRILAGAAGNGVALDVADNAETTTARPLTLGSTNGTVNIGSSTQFNKGSAGTIGLGTAAASTAVLSILAAGSATYGVGMQQLVLMSSNANNTRFSLGVDGSKIYFIGGGSSVNPTYEWRNNDGSALHMSLDNAGTLGVIKMNASSDVTVATRLGVGAGVSLLGGVPFITRAAANQNVAIVSAAGAATVLGYTDTGVSAPLLLAGTDLRFSGNGGTNEHARLTATGLGIGKTPAQALDVQINRGTWNTYETSTGIAWRGEAGAGYASGIQFTDVTNGHRWQLVKAANADQLIVQGGGDYWASSGTPYGRFDVNGFAGISGTSGQGLKTIFRGGPTGSNGSGLNFVNWNNSSSEVTLASIYCQTTSGAVGNEAGDLYFYTKPSGGALTSRLRIQDTGQVDIQAGSGNLRIGGNITRFESAEQTCPTTTNTLITVAHGGPRPPDQMQVYLRCKTAEQGFSVGDEAVMFPYEPSVTDRAGYVYQNATNVYFQWVSASNLAPYLRNKSTGAVFTVTAANWKLVFKCIWL